MTAMRTSPLHDDLHLEEDYPRAKWGEFHGMPTPIQFDEPSRELQTAQVLGLADASFLPRVVIKGSGAAAFLEALQVPIPSGIFGVSPLASGGFVARTGGSEFFLEDGVQGDAIARVEVALGAGRPGVYRVLRQDAALVIGGSRAGDLFRHASSYNFASAVENEFVMTQVTGVSCWVLRTALNGLPVFRLWTDGTFGIYIWHTLLAIARELGGDAVGAGVFFEELNRP